MRVAVTDGITASRPSDSSQRLLQNCSCCSAPFMYGRDLLCTLTIPRPARDTSSAQRRPHPPGGTLYPPYNAVAAGFKRALRAARTRLPWPEV